MSTIFYCHYNVISGEISKISPQSEKDNPEDLSICVFEIPEETAISMLSGETSPHDWVAIRDSRGSSLASYELIRKQDSNLNKISRVDGSVIVRLDEAAWGEDTDLVVVVDTVNKLVDIYIRLRTLYVTPDKRADVFMTIKNDSSFMLNAFTVDLDQMKRDIATYDVTDIKHGRQRFRCEFIPDDFSMYATRIFNTFSLEIQNDNPPNE
jgi:hypothetical protein